MKDVLTEEEKSTLCMQCHECCRWLPLSLRHDPKSEMFKQVSEFFLAHGCQAKVVKEVYVVSIPHTCQHLTATGCAIYTGRPKVCRDYDGRMDPRMSDKCLWTKATLERLRDKGGFVSTAGYSDRAEVKIT